MDILRVRKAQLPVAPSITPRKRRERKVTSAADIAEDPATVVRAEAGPSNGPGTITNAGISGAVSQDNDEDSSDSD